MRVSSEDQKVDSQLPDLEQWVKTQLGEDEYACWYIEKHTGKTMNRPEWKKLEARLNAGYISKIVVWRLDRLGRMMSEVSKLYNALDNLHVDLISIKDGINPGTITGKFVAHILTAVAEYENSIRSERIKIGMAVAKRKGKRVGGRPGHGHDKATREQILTILDMNQRGESKSFICRAVGLGRSTIYDIIKRYTPESVKIKKIGHDSTDDQIKDAIADVLEGKGSLSDWIGEQ